MVSTSCKGCAIAFEAEDEDELVTLLQAHIAEAHARGHTPTREQVLAVIRRRGAND